MFSFPDTQSTLLSRFDIAHICLAALISGVIALLVDYAWVLNLRRKMPPGPLPWPIIGNTFSLPENKPWYLFEELSKKYKSPVITFWLGRRPTVWVNDAWSAHELLTRRAGIYCSRPRMLVFAELGAGQWNLLNMYTETPAQRERFRVLRKLTHAGVGIQQVQSYRKFQNDESKQIAYDILRDPDEYVAHFERYATSVVSIIGYGRRVSSIRDPIITEVIAIMHHAADLVPVGRHFPNLLESFPWLAKFPPRLAPWMHGLGSGPPKHSRLDFFYSMTEEANDDVSVQNYSKYLFKEQPNYNLHSLEISGLSANLLGAGSDTSSSTLVTAVLAMRAFPDTCKPAWEELDRVVGSGRSPTWDDDLPYVRAFVREVFRWRSVAIIGGVPHAPTQDDIYEGYLIPKGTWVQGNVWAIHHNDREFPDPDRFEPRRFLKEGEDDDWRRPFPGERGYMTFGWGRRSCAGQALAEQGTFLSVARLLWSFQVFPAKDRTGEDIPVDIFNYTNGSNWRPRPFKVVFKPRSEEIKQTILREGEQALEDLAPYEGETKYRFSTFFQ